MNVSILNFSAVSIRQSTDFFSEGMLGFSDPFTKINGDEQGWLVQNFRMTRVNTLSHNFLLMASPVNGLLYIALGDKLLQVGN